MSIRPASHRRSHCVAALVLLNVAVVVAACSGGDSTSPPPPPHDVWNALASRSWTIPAQTEGYKCFGTQLSTDEYITGFRLASPSVAQAAVFLMVTDVPPTLGSSDCNGGTLAGHLIYAGRLGTTPITFAAGQGVHVAAGEYLLLNIHLDNSGDADVTDSTRIEGRVGTASGVTTPLEMILAGSLNINIPSDGATHTASGSCLTASNEHFVALVPLMRSRATHQKVSLTAVSDTIPQVIYDAPFDPTHVLYTPLTPDLSVPAGDRLSVVCSYINNTGYTLMFGESSQNEFCFTGVYRYPVGPANQFLNCATGVSMDFIRGET